MSRGRTGISIGAMVSIIESDKGGGTRIGLSEELLSCGDGDIDRTGHGVS